MTQPVVRPCTANGVRFVTAGAHAGVLVLCLQSMGFAKVDHLVQWPILVCGECFVAAVTHVEALVQCHSAWDFALVRQSAGWPLLALACASVAAWAGKFHYGYVHLFALHSLALCLSPAVRVLLWPSWPSGMHSSALLSPMSLDSDPNVVVQCPLLSLAFGVGGAGGRSWVSASSLSQVVREQVRSS